MDLRHQNIHIREALPDDAEQLCAWWNDGAVMAHAGFPNGLGMQRETVARQLAVQERSNYCHMILFDRRPIGEMNYRELDCAACEIGIKICDASMQNKGLGKQILSLFVTGLFEECGYQRILLDTNLNNLRAQHVYEQLGFQKLRVNRNSWIDQLGVPQSSVDYELTPATFQSYL